MEHDEIVTGRFDAIASDFAHLNESQREAVLAPDGPLLLLAGAGSGKTTVLINRIAYLLKYGADGGEPVEPWRIIAITFTNKAAGELKDRLARMLGAGAEDIWAMTFHSACVRILRRDIDRLGYDRSFTIYDTSDSQAIMKRVLKELDISDKNFPPKIVLGYISRAKDSMISAEEFLSDAEKSSDVRRRSIGRAYLEYTKRLKASNALDFDDLILITVRLLMSQPDVLEYYQKKFKYVFIDEYQDTNNLQYRLASMLAGGFGNICAVGDDDQSIYKFRGATIKNILDFEKRYKNARVIRLEQNYRSNGYILDAANDVISNNKGRKGKTLWTENGRGDKPEVIVSEDEREEARCIADTIIAGNSGGKNWSDFAVLYRMNAQSNQLETAFNRAGIPYRIVGGTGFYERMEIKDMLAYMCVINNPADDLRLLRIINTPARGIGQATIGRLSELATLESVPIFEIIGRSERYDELKSSAARLHQFADMINSLCEIAQNCPLDVFYDELLSRTGYIRMLSAKETDENLNRIENVNELKTNILAFMNENGGTLGDFLNETALYTDLDKYDRDSDSVVMMTIHSAKGLEFDTVFIAGAEEGIFPSARVIGDPEEMEEERRLCYVAMTRAKQRLYFTCARRRMLFGKTAANNHSRFIGEISDGNVKMPESRIIRGKFDFDDFDFNQDKAEKPSVKPPQRKKPPAAPKYKPPTAPAAEPLPDFIAGDIIEHKAFGRGEIVSVTQAGSDKLLEINFGGTVKRLMLKSAAKFMTKNS